MLSRCGWTVVMSALKCCRIRKFFPLQSRAGWTYTVKHRFVLLSTKESLYYNCSKSLVGVFLFSPSPTNVTVMFSSGAGVEVRLREGTMTTTVLLPEEFKNSTLGLFGKMNGDAKDDLALSNGQLVWNPNNTDEVFSFGASCKILSNLGLWNCIMNTCICSKPLIFVVVLSCRGCIQQLCLIHL